MCKNFSSFSDSDFDLRKHSAPDYYRHGFYPDSVSACCSWVLLVWVLSTFPRKMRANKSSPCQRRLGHFQDQQSSAVSETVLVSKTLCPTFFLQQERQPRPRQLCLAPRCQSRGRGTAGRLERRRSVWGLPGMYGVNQGRWGCHYTEMRKRRRKEKKDV